MREIGKNCCRESRRCSLEIKVFDRVKTGLEISKVEGFKHDNSSQEQDEQKAQKTEISERF